MTPRPRPHRPNGFSLVEILVVVCLVAVLVAVLMPGIDRSGAVRRHQALRIACLNNQKQVGLALRIHAVDNGGALPWQKAESQTNGTRGAHLSTPSTNATSADLLGFYLALTQDLAAPRILTCPADRRPAPRTNTWTHLVAHPEEGHRIPSYFLGLGAVADGPASILAGDRNLTNGPARPFRWTEVTPRSPAWAPGGDPTAVRSLGFDATTLHQSAGNLLLGDGSVQQVTNGRLREHLGNDPKAKTTAWLFPVDH